jgi:hypothetical protein
MNDISILNSIRAMAAQDMANNAQVNSFYASCGVTSKTEVFNESLDYSNSIICGVAICGSLNNPIYNFCQR